MSELIRFGVSLEKDLLRKFDLLSRHKGYSNRSEAIRGLIREELIKKEWAGNKDIAGAIILVYDHHRRELLDRLTDIQHDHSRLIISTQHIHLDHHNCLEIIVIRGKSNDARRLRDILKSAKGVKYAALTMATTGHMIP
jgi:CopG family nickel-responsive transcriptional regulator